MYLPCLVFPYHLSPSRWKTFVSVLTQTMPLTGGAWAGADTAALEDEEDAFGDAAADLLAGAGGGAETGGAAALAPAFTSGRIFSIVSAETPARDRSGTEE